MEKPITAARSDSTESPRQTVPIEIEGWDSLLAAEELH